MKQKAKSSTRLADGSYYAAIELPRNSATGVVTAFFAVVMGFAFIWHIWWMVGAGMLGAFATFVVFAWRDRSEDEMPAADVARYDRARRMDVERELERRGAAQGQPA